MFDISDATTEALVLMLVAAAIGAFIVYVLLKPRLDALIRQNQGLQTPLKEAQGGPSDGAIPQNDEAEGQRLRAALDDCTRERVALTQQVNTLKAHFEETKQQLALAQERLAAASAPLVGGDDREHESIQRLEQAVNTSEKAQPERDTSNPAAKEDQNAVLDRIRAKAETLDFDRIGKATLSEQDDLKRIKGIGPSIEEKLNALGVYAFRQIANFTPEDEDKVSDAIEFFPGRIQRDEWVRQARALMSSPDDREDQALHRVQQRAKEINFGRIGTASATVKDDLKRIKGIGPSIEKKLNAIGIYTFEQISRFTPEDDEKVNEVIEFFPGRIRRDDWRGQAEAFVKEKE